MSDFDIRSTSPADIEALETLYLAAFPEEDLVSLVRELVGGPTPVISLAAVKDGQIVGHVVFTPCGVSGSDETASLLGPLCVTPMLHKQGIGSALIKAGMEEAHKSGARQVLVLGDPAYYARSSFKPSAAIEAPYPLPAEWLAAWQWQMLDDGEPLTGRLVVPGPWQSAALWGE